MNNIMSLEGEWNFRLDEENDGIMQQWYTSELTDKIMLPGSTDEGGFGVKTTYKDPHRLSRVYEYIGAAWYQKEIFIPEDFKDKRIVLTLERCHWETTLWIDGKKIGMEDSLCSAHKYDLSSELQQGSHRLTVRVDNTIKYNVGEYAHSITKETQTNWNGVIGKIQLEVFDKISIEEIQVYPSIKDRLVRIAVTIQNNTNETAEVSLCVSAKSCNSSSEQYIPEKSTKLTTSEAASVFEFDYEMGDNIQLWDEFSPVLYELKAELQCETYKRSYRDVKNVTFGMREFKTIGSQFSINGRKLFLRGTLECCVFPLTGYPPVDLESWLQRFKVAKAYGLNHIRFHSWCPPKAAFDAADQLGLMLQIETPVWAILGEDDLLDKFIYDEGDRILRDYGNHPSFCMLAVGNEPSGEKQAEFLDKIVSYWKAKDSRHLYTGTSGWPEILANDYHVLKNRKTVLRCQDWEDNLEGRLNARPLTTDFDFKEQISSCEVPIISHEVGQWCVYPNYKEIEKYTGVLKPRNLELFKESLEQKGMLDQADDFLIASGKLQSILYKEDIEAALRTPGFGGFQLLGLTDFPGQGTALVGLLDAFWESKGYISEKDFSKFCCETIPLLRTNKFTWINDEVFKAGIEVAHYGIAVMEEVSVEWTVDLKSGENVASGEIKPVKLDFGNNKIGGIELKLENIEFNTELIITVSIKDTHYSNNWSIWIYPQKVDLTASEEIFIAQDFEEAISELNKGRKVLLLPEAEKFTGEEVPAGFTTIFWNTEWTSGQKPHTLGILCDPKTSALKNFVTDYHSNWQWFDLVANSRLMVLDSLSAELKPIVQVIDDWTKNRKIGLVFEGKVGKGSLLLCSIDLKNNINERPVAKQLLYSLLRYMESGDFNPEISVEIKSLLKFTESEFTSVMQPKV